MEKEFIDTAVQQALQMLDRGMPQHRILNELVMTAEKIAGGDAVSSILILDKNGLLRNGASPRLSYDYLTAIDGLKPNANIGTCAAAAATGMIVITPDFRADNKWGGLRHLPLALGFVGAWSMPIKNDNGKVLGTFGTYFREMRQPSENEVNCIGSLAGAAAKVLNHER